MLEDFLSPIVEMVVDGASKRPRSHRDFRDFRWCDRPHPTFVSVSNGGARLVLARMHRYSASLLVQESGFHQLVAEFNKGGGIARASLAQEVAATVANAMTSFSQVCRERATPLTVCARLGSVFRGECGPYPGGVLDC